MHCMLSTTYADNDPWPTPYRKRTRRALESERLWTFRVEFAWRRVRVWKVAPSQACHLPRRLLGSEAARKSPSNIALYTPSGYTWGRKNEIFILAAKQGGIGVCSITGGNALSFFTPSKTNHSADTLKMSTNWHWIDVSTRLDQSRNFARK